MGTIFDAVMATEAGRIQPVNATPVQGAWVMCLGADLPGHRGNFKTEDGIKTTPTDPVALVAGLATVSAVRVKGAKTALPNGWTWRFQLIDVNTRADGWIDVEVPRDGDFTIPAVGVYNSIGGSTGGEGASDVRWQLLLYGPADTVIEAEIPAVYFDALTTFEVDAPLVWNTVPAPAQRRVLRTAVVAFSITDERSVLTPSANFPIASIDVYADGVKIVSAGTPIGGWGANVDNYYGAAVVRLTPPGSYGSDVDVAIRVTNASAPGGRAVSPFSFAWTFHTVDQTAPKLVGAVAVALDTVRVTFDDDMFVGTASDPLSALYAPAYALEGNAVPFYAPTPLVVLHVEGRTFDVIFDGPLSPGVLYTIRAYDITDDEGNPIDATDGAQFTAARPAPVAGRDFVLFRMFPAIVQDQDQQAEQTLRRFLAVLQEPVDLLLGSVDAWIDLIDPERAALRFVDAMLTDLGNPFDLELTETEKRILLLDLVPVLKLRGTDPGIIAAVGLLANVPITIGAAEVLGSLLGGGDLLGDTFLLGADPQVGIYSFSVTSSVVLTPALRERVAYIVRKMKPRHTHFVRIYEPDDDAGGSGLLDESDLDGDLLLN